jgi:4'-phosphopantetheinyl transferase
MTSLPPHSSLNPLTLPENQVHVWLAVLDLASEELKPLESTLAADEQYFVVRHGILRQILSRYLDCEPRALQFAYGTYGKPFLRSDHEESKLRFNMAHSHGMAVFAIARNREIGVDLERIDHRFAAQRIAKLFFSRRECSTLRALPASQQLNAFFHCWTRKEAYVKAHGVGLQMQLNSFDVSLLPLQSPELLRGGHENWWIHSPNLARGYAVAVAVQAPGCDLRTLGWNSRFETGGIAHTFRTAASAWRKKAAISGKLPGRNFFGNYLPQTSDTLPSDPAQ